MGADILRSLPFSILEFQPHEISKITAQLCIAVGRGHILVPKDSRFSLLDGSSLCVDDKDLWIRNWWKMDNSHPSIASTTENFAYLV
jgi:hypothetical protein